MTSALELASPNANFTRSTVRFDSASSEVGDVEADVERVALVVDGQLFLGLFLLAVRADDLELVGAEHDAHAAEFLVGQDGGALQRGQELDAVELDVLAWPDRDHAVEVGKLAVDDLAHELDVGEAEAHLVGQDVDA